MSSNYTTRIKRGDDEYTFGKTASTYLHNIANKIGQLFVHLDFLLVVLDAFLHTSLFM
jgi:hypothetical protein